ncbi:Uncharacterized protein dnm_074010 [Desulfonema magnum]|uniref:Uncharacterized protein n=1 Tax=Desulfonema magnum TaxID=45655 RepID=A0A975BTD7_9BACT|nr:Uncharacterized protein dnm_074010 [Desulfonema magnum]
MKAKPVYRTKTCDAGRNPAFSPSGAPFPAEKSRVSLYSNMPSLQDSETQHITCLWPKDINIINQILNS